MPSRLVSLEDSGVLQRLDDCAALLAVSKGCGEAAIDIWKEILIIAV